MDLVKHLEIFDPRKILGSVGIVGAGAVGSALAVQLAKLGIEKLNIYDFDHIVAHNIPNQIPFAEKHIGKSKAPVLAKICNDLVDNKIATGYVKRIDKTFSFIDEIVFFCVDTMKARKEIFENCLFMKGTAKLLLDTRMDARSVRVNICNLNDLKHCKYYGDTLYSDDDVDSTRGTCGITLSLGSTAGIAACFATQMLIDWVMKTKQDTFQVIIDLKSWRTIPTPFSVLEEDILIEEEDIGKTKLINIMEITQLNVGSYQASYSLDELMEE